MRLIRKTFAGLKRFMVRTFHEVKALGWFWGSVVAILAFLILYSPSIIGYIMYWITEQGRYLAIATGYVAFWQLPLISPGFGTYFAIMAILVKLISRLRRNKKTIE